MTSNSDTDKKEDKRERVVGKRKEESVDKVY